LNHLKIHILILDRKTGEINIFAHGFPFINGLVTGTTCRKPWFKPSNIEVSDHFFHPISKHQLHPPKK
jgi:hypothetical protein